MSELAIDIDGPKMAIDDKIIDIQIALIAKLHALGSAQRNPEILSANQRPICLNLTRSLASLMQTKKV